MSADTPDSMRALHLEHGRLGKLLDVIQQQQMNLSRSGPVQFHVLQLAFDYLAGYPDKCHHPKEDMVYSKLCSRIPGMAESVGALVQEHAKLARLTASIRGTLSHLRQHAGAPQDVLAAQLAEYLDFYRHHMATEEKLFFPVAQASLSSDDWAEIDSSVFDHSDELLDRGSEGPFALLRDELTRHGEIEKAKAAERMEAEWLASIRSIDEFNVGMRRSGRAASLTRNPDGGYALSYPGRPSVHIPACSEVRASWCAYYYLKGNGTLRQPPAKAVLS